MDAAEPIFIIRGINYKEPPLTVTSSELMYLIEKDLVVIMAKKIRNVIQIELGNFYNDGMGGVSGRYGESAKQIKENRINLIENETKKHSDNLTNTE